MQTRMKTALVAAMLVSICMITQAQAQSPLPQDPPQGAEPIAGEALRMRVSGKTFKYSVSDSPVTSRIQYNANGYVFLNVSTGLNDSAAWRIEGGQLCADWKKIPPSCNDMRVKGDLLFAKRLNGTWGTLTPD